MEDNSVRLECLTEDDAQIVLDLYSQPDWVRFIGDRGVSDLTSAEQYLKDNLLPLYQTKGLGLKKIINQNELVVGLAGLVKRPTLSVPDLGYGLLSSFYGHGYARMACELALQQNFYQSDLNEVAAIVTPDNARSKLLLEKLGFKWQFLQKGPQGEWLDFYLLKKTKA